MTDDERRFSIPETASISGSSRRCCTVRAPNPEGFRQSMFQNLSLGIEGFLGRWRNHNVFRLRKKPSGFFAKHFQVHKRLCFLTILARRENPPTADASSSDSVRKTIVTKLKRIAANQCLQFTRKNRDRSRTMAIAVSTLFSLRPSLAIIRMADQPVEDAS